MLAAMETGKVDAILCWHTDRLYRNMKDLERVIEIADANQVEIRTVQGGTLDLSTSAGRMVARILGSVARQESEHTSERRKRANAQKAAAGEWTTSRKPFGYTITGEPLEPEADAVRKAVADVLAGKSLRAIAREWNASGLQTSGSATHWRSPMVKRILVNPRYAGLVVHRGQVVGQGNWEPLIDEDTHRGAVAFLTDPSRGAYIGFERLYQGSSVYFCGVCGSRLFGWKPSGGKPRAYACPTRRHVRRQGEALDDYVSAIVVRRLSQPDAIALVTPSMSVDIARLHGQRMGLLARQEELAALFAEGSVSAAQLKRGTAELGSAIGLLEADLAAATQSSPAAALVDGQRRSVSEMEKRWSQLSGDIRGKIVDQLLIVTVNPSPRGLRRFDPAYINVAWRE